MTSKEQKKINEALNYLMKTVEATVNAIEGIKKESGEDADINAIRFLLQTHLEKTRTMLQT